MDKLLSFVDNKTLEDASSVGGDGLKEIKNDVFVPSFLVNPLSYLKKGCIIWIRANENHSVYELTRDSSESELLSFIEENIV